MSHRDSDEEGDVIEDAEFEGSEEGDDIIDEDLLEVVEAATSQGGSDRDVCVPATALSCTELWLISLRFSEGRVRRRR
jgi:hypothetical protein